ncbi:uncharacterized protein J7T54_004107, partial [Emericellopsis cladophorae]
DTVEEAAEEDDLLVDLAEGSNHSFRTFNHAYAGSTTLAINTIMHRAYRASLSWRTLFRVDEVLAKESAARTSQGHKRQGSALETGVVGAYKKARLRSRPEATEIELVAAARTLYNNPSMQLRRPGQREAILAALGPRAAEQVVVVLATGSGKTLLVMLSAMLKGAGTTILILPTVALRSNILERLREAGVKAIVWAPGESRAAPLVIVSAEAACTRGFLDYAFRLEAQQRLDRIVVDECHLTLTATFRKSMVRLGSFVRQVRTQSVWLTATLPPSFEEAFARQNFLVRPRIVRESTNRANVRYRIERYRGPGTLCDQTVDFVRNLLASGGGLELDRDTTQDDSYGKARMIIYCPTLDAVTELAEALGCLMYVGDREMMSSEDKDAAIERWLHPAGSPVIVATSALGVGFDYPHVRWVVHAGPPRRMTDFSQESGRAGRDRKPAESIILLSAGWRPGEPADLDEESMQLYLTGRHCLRAVISQFLDQPLDWRWCMADEDELCGVCPRPYTEPRPVGQLILPDVAKKAEATELGQDATTDPGPVYIGSTETNEYTGPDEVLRRARLDEETLGRFEARLEAMRGCCLLCRIEGGRPFDHAAATCGRRWPWIRAKEKTIRACRDEGKPWMAKFTACFRCYMPQALCTMADPDARATQDSANECRFRDIVMPLCYGAFFRAGPRALIKKHSPRAFRNIDDYMRWLGEPSELGGTLCVQAVRIADILLREI